MNSSGDEQVLLQEVSFSASSLLLHQLQALLIWAESHEEYFKNNSASKSL